MNNYYCFPGSFFAFFDSEVERELGLLFSKGGKWRPEIGNQAKQSRGGTKFQMLVEDIREGVLVSFLLDNKTFSKFCSLIVVSLLFIANITHNSTSVIIYT